MGWNFFTEFVRQLKASRIMELTDSVLKNSFNQLLFQLKFSFACNINDFPFGFSLATSWKVVNGKYKRKLITVFQMVNGKTGE